MNEIKNPSAVALGSIKSEKKAKTSRLNGKKGGRPIKPSQLFEGEKSSLRKTFDETVKDTKSVDSMPSESEEILSVEEVVGELLKEARNDFDLAKASAGRETSFSYWFTEEVTKAIASRDAYWQNRLNEKVQRDVLKGARRRVIEQVREEAQRKIINKILALPTEVFMDGDEPTDYKKVDDIMKVI